MMKMTAVPNGYEDNDQHFRKGRRAFADALSIDGRVIDHWEFGEDPAGTK